MTIDLYFTGESLASAKGPLCGRYRRGKAGFRYDYRQNGTTGETLGLDPELAPLLPDRDRRYSSGLDEWEYRYSYVYYDELPGDLAARYRQRADQYDQLSAWDRLTLTGNIKRQRICRICRVRSDYSNGCDLYLINIAGGPWIKIGLIYALVHLARTLQSPCTASYAESWHRDIRALYGICRHTPVDAGRAMLYETRSIKPVYLDEMDYIFGKSAGTYIHEFHDRKGIVNQQVGITWMPFVDEFMARYFFRPDDLALPEIEQVMPLMQSLLSLAKSAMESKINDEQVKAVNYLARVLEKYITMLETAVKYRLDIMIGA
jgi:hypothetical protein